MSVNVTVISKITARDIVTTNASLADTSNAFILYDGLDTSQTLNSSSTPPASLMAAFTVTMTSGVATVDLTALTGTNGAAVNGTGLKVQAIKISPHDTNGAAITIKVGATNGYDLNGSAWSETLGALDAVLIEKVNTAPVIGSGAKTFDISGTGTDALDLIIIMG